MKINLKNPTKEGVLVDILNIELGTPFTDGDGVFIKGAISRDKSYRPNKIKRYNCWDLFKGQRRIFRDGQKVQELKGEISIDF